MGTYLAGCSPYISKLVYDIDKRVLLMECVNNATDNIPHTRVTFTGVRSYSEEIMDDEYDDHNEEIERQIKETTIQQKA